MKPFYGHTTYIWQRPEWPDFHWDSEALLAPLARLSHLHGRLDGQMSMLGFGDKSETQLTALTEELLGSSAIEGMTLNADSVRSSIARRLGMESVGLPDSDHYVEGLVDVMLDAVTSPDKPLSRERLFDWHCALFPTGRSGMYRITVGDWHKGKEPMQVISGAFGREKVHYEAPPSEAVPEEMEGVSRTFL